MHVLIPSANPLLVTRCIQSISNTHEEPWPFTVGIIAEPGDIWMGYAEGDTGIILIPYEPQNGFIFAEAINTGIEYWNREGPFFLLNDDAEVLTENGILALIEAAGIDSLGVISAAIRGVGGTPDQQQETVASLRLAEKHVSFTAAVITQAAIEKVGLLDERFIGYGFEDNDYCLRCNDAGLGVAIYDSCVVRHVHPSTTFKAKGINYNAKYYLGESILLEKRAKPREGLPVVVIGGSRSGASVVAAAIGELGVQIADQAPAWSPSTSPYYRDPLLATLVGAGPEGRRLYVNRRWEESGGKPWAVRVWPNAAGVIGLLEAIGPCKIVMVARSPEAVRRSFALQSNISMEKSQERIANEIRDLYQIGDAVGQTHEIMVINYDELIDNTKEVIEKLADFVGHRKSTTAAQQRVLPHLRTFLPDGQLAPTTQPEGFGKIAVGVRIGRYPSPGFVNCAVELARTGMREGDVWLPAAVGVPAHWAATNLMRAFLLTDCDTLLLLDDDMTFSGDILNGMRDNEENWRFDIVSGLATQRVTPPRALVLRKGEQPPVPDSLQGVYYDLLVEEVQEGKVMQVDATGFAFTLIRRKVIEAFTSPHGPQHTSYVNWGEGGEGEDVNFCRRAGSLGFTVAVDCGACVGHVGEVVYGYDEFDLWRRQGRSSTGLSIAEMVELVGESIPFLTEENRERGLALLRAARGISHV